MHPYLKRMVRQLPVLSTYLRKYEVLAESHAELSAGYQALKDEYGLLKGNFQALKDSRDVLEGNYQTLITAYETMNDLYIRINTPFIKAFPPGHFYSPIPSMEEIQKNHHQIFETSKDLDGVDLNDQGQVELFMELAKFYNGCPFSETKQEFSRFYYENPAYGYTDALFLYSMIRYLKPRRIIEVGSGFSSCATLDTNEAFFDSCIDCTFIEPYPQLLLSIKREHDNLHIIPNNVQDVPLSTFDALTAGDILFIDSTHVSKIGSDVNFIFFEILPRLTNGVYIHFHDIAYPFEYPEHWVYEGRAWNEMYMMHAFLQYNSAYRIRLFASYLWQFHEDLVAGGMPLAARNKGGNLWLEKRMGAELISG